MSFQTFANVVCSCKPIIRRPMPPKEKQHPDEPDAAVVEDKDRVNLRECQSETE